MKLIKIVTFVFVFITTNFAIAQDDLLSQLEAVKPAKKQIEMAAFKGLQVCTMQATKLPAKGEFYLLISHRFGDLTNGFDNFFGLDNALAKIGGIYGVTDWLSLGASRQTYNKTYELASKLKFADQEIEGFPITVVLYNTFDINSSLKKEIYPDLQFNNRMAYSSQFIVSRKVNESISVELNTVYVHKNLYDPSVEKKDQLLIALGGRCKLTKRMSFNLEYAAKTIKTEYSPYTNPLTAGFDIETGGHVFQLVFSNSQPMNDVAYFTNGTGSWGGKTKGIYFGFNLYRVF